MGLVAGATGAASVLGLRRANATFGQFPADAMAALLPANVRAKRVLEIFLYGGLSPWETLYFVEANGKPTDLQYPNQQYYTFASQNDGLVSTCGNGAGRPVQPFGKDALNQDVQIGPFGAKLYNRADVRDRMRIVVQAHNLEPHEAAVPQALTGRPVGNPNAAGLGAHIQRARIEAGPERAAPHSYVFATGGITSDNVSAAASPGAHPGAARPLLLKTDQSYQFTDLLARSGVGSNRATNDALVQAYVDQYQGRLTWPNQGRVRSPRTDDMTVAFSSAKNVDAIDALMTGNGIFANRGGAACGQSTSSSIPAIGIDAAAKLLTHPTDPASYVCVSDIGIREASGGGGYDTHSNNANDQAMNFDNILNVLLSYIDDGTHAPNTFSLDDVLVILNTEFGRTPTAQGGDGRNHHPYGYVTAFIGGPITSAQKGIFGAIGPDGNASGEFGTPAENRAAALLALGIWPFAPEAFAVSDFPGTQSELDGAKQAMRKFLGRIV